LVNQEFIVDGVCYRNPKAYISLRGLGKIVYDGDFTFPSRIMNSEEVQGVEELVKDSGLFDLGLSMEDVDIRNNVFNNDNLYVVQIKAPSSLAGVIRSIPDKWRKRRKQLFETCHYVDQLNWYVAQVGDKFSLSTELIEVFSYTTQLTVLMKQAMAKVKGLRGKPRRYAIKEFVNPVTKRIDEYVTATCNLLNDHDLYLEYNDKQMELEIHARSLDAFQYNGFMTPSDIRNSSMAFIDTENPLFMHEGSKTSWVGVSFYENQKPVRKIIFSMALLDVSCMDGIDGEYEIISEFDSYTEFEKAISQCFSEQNPLMIIGQNLIWYDLQKMREDSLDENDEFDLILGCDRKAKVSATILAEKKDDNQQTFYEKLFQKIGADCTIVLDTYQVARQGLSFLKPLKLENILAHLFPNAQFTKSVSYDEMESLQVEFENGDMQAGQLLCRYLVDDVDAMVPLILNPQSQYDSTNSVSAFSFDDYCNLASRFRLNFEKLLYTPRVIESYFERRFFETTGTFFDTVYPYIPKFQKLNKSRISKFKTRVRKAVHQITELVSLLPDDTTIGYLPWADYVAELWLSDKLKQKYPAFSEFLLDHKYSRDPHTSLQVSDEYCVRTDPKRQLFLSKFIESFMRQMVIDYGAAVLDKDIDPKARSRFYARYGFEPDIVMNMIHVKVEEAHAKLSKKGINMLKTDYRGQFTFLSGVSDISDVLTNGALAFDVEKGSTLIDFQK